MSYAAPSTIAAATFELATGWSLQQCFPDNLPWYSYQGNDYIFTRMKFNSACTDSQGNQYQWGKIEGIYPPIDEPDGGCSSACVSGYGRGEARGCTSMQPEFLVGFNYNCDEGACYCLYERDTWSDDNSPCFDSMDTSYIGDGDVSSTQVQQESTCYSLFVQPSEHPAPPAPPSPPAPPTDVPGSSICDHAPDYECYENGWPPCCDQDNGDDCPSFQTMCNNHGEDMTGTSYCTNAPDYHCWQTGWPSCCGAPGGDYMNCPKEQPDCDDSAMAGSSFSVKYLRAS